MFETQEKRREIQKEIERAQQLISDARDVGEEGETPSDPDEDFTEGEELEKVIVLFVLIYHLKKGSQNLGLFSQCGNEILLIAWLHLGFSTLHGYDLPVCVMLDSYYCLSSSHHVF